jgi:hypothetical protein
MSTRRPLFFGFLPLVILLAGASVWIGLKAIPMKQYSQRSFRIHEKIMALRDRRPASVSPQVWEECVGWIVTAQGNICFSEEDASYRAMARFEEQLDEKLKGDVDLGTIEWIGDRLAETGPRGQQYIANWRDQWRAHYRSRKPEEESQGR